MDKLKNILKSDTPADEPTSSGPTATGKISGQGSHFPGKDEAPTTVTGTDPTTKGPSDVSASAPNPSQAAYTAGPEASGTGHVGTVSEGQPTSSYTISNPSATTGTTGTTGTTQEASSYTVSGADFPRTESAADGSGTAAIGTTSTYSSSPLTKGDPVSSVVDTDSRDPLTYKKPESSGGAVAGVGPGAASAAATSAFTSDQERSATELAGHENPYRAAALDPRVDGGAARATGLAGAGATQAYSTSSTAPASSTLTTTVDPVDRSATYGQSTETKGLDSAKPTESTEDADRKPSLANRVLGAVGLGGIAGAIGAKSAEDRDTAVDDSQPTTTTGISSYTAPTESGPGGGHKRKESIPTTAYPAGPDSPAAINAPIGGTRSNEQSSSATAAGVGTAAATGIGAAAVGDRSYRESGARRENITGQPTSSAPPIDTTTGVATTGVSGQRYDESSRLRDSAVLDAPTTQQGTSSAHQATTATTPAQEEDHTGRNTAIGAGVGAAAVGAGAYGAHEYSKRDAEKAEAEAAQTQAAREKELQAQRKEAEKQAAKEHEAAEKQAAKEEKQHQKEVEKAEKEHQKEIEKEEKKHQKEVEKAEKEHQKEVEKEEKKQHKEAVAIQKEHEREEQKRQYELQKEEEERRKRAAAVVTDPDDKGKEKEDKEKKPGLFKRIFKRRKNEKTGEDEEYSTDEEDNKGTAIAGGTAVAAAGAGTAAYASREHDPATSSAQTHPTSTSTQEPLTTAARETGPTSSTQEAGPLSSDPLASTQPPTGSGPKGFVSAGPDGKESYTVVPQAAPEGTSSLAASDVAGGDPRPREPITGLPYDPAKDPSTAEVLGHHQTGPGASATSAGTTTGEGHVSLEERIEALKGEKFGVIDETRR